MKLIILIKKTTYQLFVFKVKKTLTLVLSRRALSDVKTGLDVQICCFKNSSNSNVKFRVAGKAC